MYQQRWFIITDLIQVNLTLACFASIYAYYSFNYFSELEYKFIENEFWFKMYLYWKAWFNFHFVDNFPLQANRHLLSSMAQSSQNIDLLNLAKLNIQSDLRSKSAAVKIDGDVFRLRRNRASHRWPIGGHFWKLLHKILLVLIFHP